MNSPTMSAKQAILLKTWKKQNSSSLIAIAPVLCSIHNELV